VTRLPPTLAASSAAIRTDSWGSSFVDRCASTNNTSRIFAAAPIKIATGDRIDAATDSPAPPNAGSVALRWPMITNDGSI